MLHTLELPVFKQGGGNMRNRISLVVVSCVVAASLWACGSSDDEGAEKVVGCVTSSQAACVAADSGNGYGKCIWVGSACAMPSAESSCATYADEGSCTGECTWTAGACTGEPGTSGLECSEYTTQVACEIPCGWLGTVCAVDPCIGVAEAACTTTDSFSGYGKCIWEAGECTAPTVESSCATYMDEASCTGECTWADDACTGEPGTSGLECSEYTTQVACEIPCGWNGTACIVE